MYQTTFNTLKDVNLKLHDNVLGGKKYTKTNSSYFNRVQDNFEAFFKQFVR